MESKKRLDKLIRKSRADLYKPIAIAEVLFRHRTENLNLSELEIYRRDSYKWMKDVIRQLHNKTTELNSKYWDQLFNEEVLPPVMMKELGNYNVKNKGLVEIYIYAHVQKKFASLASLRDTLESISPSDFSLDLFLNFFQKNAKFRGSIDKAYEIVVYALFNAVVEELKAKVTLSIDKKTVPVLKDFEDFAQLVLGIDSKHLTIEKHARLFRVGTANANDAGLDMWANFGPVVQVKHISLKPKQVTDICSGVRADQVIIVCKKNEAGTIQTVLQQLGLNNNLRGVITEVDLDRWYKTCFVCKYQESLGKRVIHSIVQEMKLEFPLSQSQNFSDFFSMRKYSPNLLRDDWKI